MEMILENKGYTTSTPDFDFLMCAFSFNLGYTTEKISELIVPIKDSELNSMSLAYAERSFKDGWDNLSEEEDKYWNSFLEV